jgi:Uncharacterized protein conserved in bacteria
MNRDQWNGGLKQLKGASKKYWGKLTGDIILETMGELERLLGVFQRQYGHLKARERRDNRWDMSSCAPLDRASHEGPSFVLIHGSTRSQSARRRLKPNSPPLELS